jgi:hypothetical protein
MIGKDISLDELSTDIKILKPNNLNVSESNKAKGL